MAEAEKIESKPTNWRDYKASLRVLSVTARAGEVFANREKALEWLQSPNPALAGATPLSALETEAGHQEVEDILGRIEHGVLG